ncbi:hypothetical protein MIR68_004354 [Amoeboaphelidium protococcarum]|nr:hypothetical protein MIR68_004354 [Amoeboaphelidium protococcarum]
MSRLRPGMWSRKSDDDVDASLDKVEHIKLDLTQNKAFDKVKISRNDDMINVAFCTIGNRQPNLQSEIQQYEADVRIPLWFANWCKQYAKVPYFSYLSYVHTLSTSTRTMLKLKGQAEAGLKELDFDHLTLVKPAWIKRPFEEYQQRLIVMNKDGQKASSSKLEQKHMKALWWIEENCRMLPFVMWVPSILLPSRMQSIDARTVARSMVADAELFCQYQNSGLIPDSMDVEKDNEMWNFNIRQLYYSDMIKLAESRLK